MRRSSRSGRVYARLFTGQSYIIISHYIGLLPTPIVSWGHARRGSCSIGLFLTTWVWIAIIFAHLHGRALECLTLYDMLTYATSAIGPDSSPLVDAWPLLLSHFVRYTPTHVDLREVTATRRFKIRNTMFTVVA